MKRKLPKTKLLADARAEMTEEEYFESKSFSEHLVAVFKFMTRCENNVTIHVKNMFHFHRVISGTVYLTASDNPFSFASRSAFSRSYLRRI